MPACLRWLAVGVAGVLMVSAAPPAQAQSRTARTVRFDSPALGGQATFAILLPPGYEESAKRYPALYLLHGGTQNHTAFPARSWFTKEASRRDMIVVMPDLPPAYFNGRGGAAAPFEDFLVTDLAGYVDANYRTVASREARAIAGISIGGFAATMVGLKHGDTFGIVGPISPALTASNRQRDLEMVVAMLSAESAPYFYIACGAQDAVAAASRQLAQLLAARGIAHEYKEVPGDHSWVVWDPQVQAFFDVLSQQPGWHPTAQR
jgi:putative tributyrin esterase